MSPVAINGVDKQGVAINGVQVKQALNAANEIVAKGVYDATTLSAVDADLAVDNIKLAENIFGFVGTLAGGGVETFEEYYYASLGAGAIYTPTDPGLFSAAKEDAAEKLRVNLYNNNDELIEGVTGIGAVVGDGTYLDFKNDGIAAKYVAIMRHYISTGTYEEYYHLDIAGGASYTPGDEGFFSEAPEFGDGLDLRCEYEGRYWYLYSKGGSAFGGTLIIGDGSNFRVRNNTGGALRTNLMRATMS